MAVAAILEPFRLPWRQNRRLTVRHLAGSGRRARYRIVGTALTLAAAASPLAGPSRFGFSDRVERHLFPEVTTGPSEPTWSPDGKWIAFSMQGDIWKVPAEGGEAIALTQGPWYHFEPEWSPDGRSIAMTIDTGGNLDIGVVGADGGVVPHPTPHSPSCDCSSWRSTCSRRSRLEAASARSRQRWHHTISWSAGSVAACSIGMVRSAGATVSPSGPPE